MELNVFGSVTTLSSFPSNNLPTKKRTFPALQHLLLLLRVVPNLDFKTNYLSLIINIDSQQPV